MTEQHQALCAAQKQCDEEIRALMAAEDFAAGVFFAAQIHALHQEKNMLETHKAYRQVRLKRLGHPVKGSA